MIPVSDSQKVIEVIARSFDRELVNFSSVRVGSYRF
jgi:hypothetical protein